MTQIENESKELRVPADAENLRLLTEQHWEAFVAGWERRLVDGLGAVTAAKRAISLDTVTQRIVSERSISFGGATHEALAEVERSLGKRLPDSIKAFYSCSNGLLLPLHSSLIACQRFQRLNEVDPELCAMLQPDAYSRQVLAHPKEITSVLELLGRRDVSPQQLASVLMLPPVPDDDYYVYGDDQDDLAIRGHYASDSVVINELPEFGSGGSGWAVLNPHVIFEDGEWEVWEVNPWGHRRHRKFVDFLACLYLSSVEVLDQFSTDSLQRPRLPT